MGANAQTTVPTFTAGQILTAAQQNQSARTGVPVFADTTARDAAFGGTGEKTLAEGQLCYLESTNVTQQYDGTNWVAVAPPVAIFNETQAANTAGGGATSGSFAKRTLNTTVVNQIDGCSIASSVITLPAGTYQVEAQAPVFSVTTNISRLQNTSDATTTITGTSNYATTDTSSQSFIIGTFTITASKNFEVQTRVGATKATNGLGVSTGLGANEIYTTIIITKTA